MIVLLIGLCGAAGAVARFLVDRGVQRVWVTRAPVATFAINLSGSFVLGVVAAATADESRVGLAIGVGFCGGYTTFSTAMVETVSLVRERRLGTAVTYLLGQPLACVIAAAGGYVLAGR